MGKGKKKGDKKKDGEPKDEEPSLSTLSISEDQPSSSQGTSEGLTGGGGGGSKKSKKKGAGELAPEVQAPAPTPVVETSVQQEPKTEDVEEEGLGLGGARKKRPKKKKETSEVASKAGPAPAQTVSTPQIKPIPAAETPAPSSTPSWRAKPQADQPGPLATQLPQGHPRPQPGPLPGPHPSAQPSPIYPAQQRGVQQPPGQPIGQPHPQSAPASQADSSWGRGRGRGQAPQQPSAPRKPGPQPSQQPSQSQPMPIQQYPQTQVQRVQPAANYKIPSKIIGNTVRVRPIQVLTNYLPMRIKPQKIYRYDVSIVPDRPKRMIPKAFIAAKDKHFKNHLIAFDQSKNCYSLNPLPNVPQIDRFSTNVEIVDNNGRTMNFEVSFKATGIVDLRTIIEYMENGTSLNPPTEAIQCVDVILRQGTLESYIKAGRQFFRRPGRPIDLGDGLEMWTGLFQSAIFTSRPFINIDVAHKGFPRQQPLINAISQDFRLDLNRPITQQRSFGTENFLNFIKGLRVIASIGGDREQKREFICNELVDPPNILKFTMTDANGRQQLITVADYFSREKGIRLKYPNLNCMWVGPRDKKIYYPMELLEVSYGQALNKQLNDRQLATMVREAATPPDVRKAKIEEVISNMNYSKNPYFRHFGLEIKEEFSQVPAKVLIPPKLEVGGGPPLEPRKGVWQANRLLKAEALESWTFLALEGDPNSSNAEQIISLLMNIGNRMGMRVSPPKQNPIFYNVRIDRLQNVLYEARKMDIKFVVIIVPTRGRDYYHRVKKIAELEVGILTQCIKEYTATRRMNEQTARNILLKVNSKLMGINQALDNSRIPKCLAEGGVMVVGADVTHPSPDQSSVPSIAAVTASIDQKCFIYNIQLSVQTPKKETIVEFEDMMVEHLKVYRDRQRSLPRKIFVFRDGVSEGQFEQVMNSELRAVHNAYHTLAGPNAKPEVLFLLVQKRHHTRFFQPSGSQNVEPGTVVDTDIVHARELDFYLVSHQAIKGTARPTRYHAVSNDGRIPHDEVEQLTYYLCHLYSRCMRSVSYPTPTYYAHLACLRARSLTFGDRFNNAELERNPQRLRVKNEILEASRMFFV